VEGHVVAFVGGGGRGGGLDYEGGEGEGFEGGGGGWGEGGGEGAVVAEEEGEGVPVGGVHVVCDADFRCCVVVRGLGWGVCHFEGVWMYDGLML